MCHCRGDAVAANGAASRVFAVMGQAGHGFRDRGELVRQGARLGRKVSASMIGRWIREKLAIARGEGIHVVKSPWSLSRCPRVFDDGLADHGLRANYQRFS